MQKNGLGKYVDAGEIATLVTEKTDRILASKHRTNWKPPVADPEGIEQRTWTPWGEAVTVKAGSRTF